MILLKSKERKTHPVVNQPSSLREILNNGSETENLLYFGGGWVMYDKIAAKEALICYHKDLFCSLQIRSIPYIKYQKKSFQNPVFFVILATLENEKESESRLSNC